MWADLPSKALNFHRVFTAIARGLRLILTLSPRTATGQEFINTQVKAMSHSHTSQPEKHGAGHHADAPQVAVRDGNRLLCPCCGQVLMVLKEKRFTPPKMHHQQGDPRRTWPALEKLIAKQEAYLNASPEETSQEEPAWADRNIIRPFYRADALVVPIDPKVAAYAFPEGDPPRPDQASITKPVNLPEARAPKDTLHDQPPRDSNTRYEEHQRRRAQRPLEEPFTEEGARLAVRLEKEIAKKQARVERLRARLSGEKQDTSNQPSNEKPMNMNEHRKEKNNAAPRQQQPLRTKRSHAYEDVSMACAEVTKASANGAKHRGPP